MELPITKPSQVSYADELVFSELLEKMEKNRYNGFIRVTHSSEEGYVLFKDGKKVAASYDRFLKSEAIDQIELAFEKSDTLIEVFDLKESQMDYLLDLNKVYKLEEKPPAVPTPPTPEPKFVEDSEKLFNPKEASYRKSAESLREEMELQYAQDEIVSETETEEKPAEMKTEAPKVETIASTEKEVPEPVPEKIKVSETVMDEETTSEEIPEKTLEEKPEIPEVESEPEPQELAEPVNETESVSEPEIEEIPEEPEISKELETPTKAPESLEVSETEIIEDVEAEPEIPMDRTDLLKKYGLRDIDEEEVETILDTYKGGSISSENIEKIELTLMNKIKKSVMGMPKVDGIEVMVFLESTPELSGRIKIIAVYAGKGLLSRFMGDSKDIQNLKYQITDIAEMEIRKSFREYPQIVDSFDIDIEIHSP